jgi:hypothetical protein
MLHRGLSDQPQTEEAATIMRISVISSLKETMFRKSNQGVIPCTKSPKIQTGFIAAHFRRNRSAIMSRQHRSVAMSRFCSLPPLTALFSNPSPIQQVPGFPSKAIRVYPQRMQFSTIFIQCLSVSSSARGPWVTWPRRESAPLPLPWM